MATAYVWCPLLSWDNFHKNALNIYIFNPNFYFTYYCVISQYFVTTWPAAAPFCSLNLLQSSKFKREKSLAPYVSDSQTDKTSFQNWQTLETTHSHFLPREVIFITSAGRFEYFISKYSKRTSSFIKKTEVDANADKMFKITFAIHQHLRIV